MFVWEWETLEILKQMAADLERTPEKQLERVQEQLLSSGALREGGEGSGRLEEEADQILETLLTWEMHMASSGGGKPLADYYLKRDGIVLVQEKDGRAACMLLPTIQLASGSVASLIPAEPAGPENGGVSLLFEGEAKGGYPGFSASVRPEDGLGYFLEQDGESTFYGKDSRGRLTGRICRWMLYAHRELICRMLKQSQDGTMGDRV